MLRLSKLSKAYGLKVLLDEVDLELPVSGKVALVGPNGCGKTTLLNMIAGLEAPDGGAIVKAAAKRIGYLPQQPNPSPEASLLEECLSGARQLFGLKVRMGELVTLLHEKAGDKAVLAEYEEIEARFRCDGGYALEARACEILTGLGFASSFFAQSPLVLSGGYRMRLELAKIFLDDPDALILDEPTNHLDLPALAWTEAFLKRYRGLVIFVSHDRILLNRLADVTMHLPGGGRLTLYQGNFDAFLRQREADIERNEALRERLAAQRKNHEKFVERFGAKATKASQARSRMKMIERLKLLEQGIEVETETAGARIAFAPATPSGRVVIKAKELAIGYEGVLASGINLTVERGQRIAVIGSNGIGKSTLIKTIAGMVPPKAGEVQTGHQVKTGYFAQDPTDLFDPERDPLSHLLDAGTAMTTREARALLGSFLFRAEEVFKKPGVLSGGEKNRLAMALLLARRPNFLLLDEPTNHLDMQSVELLIDALAQYEGTLLFVSHNRDFIDALCTHLLVMLPDGRHALFHGQLDDYRRMASLTGFPDVLCEETPARGADKDNNTTRAAKTSDAPSNDAIRQMKSLRQKLKKSLEQWDKNQCSLRAAIAALHIQMSAANPKDYQNICQIQDEITAAERSLGEAEDTWLAESEELERIESELTSLGRL